MLPPGRNKALGRILPVGLGFATCALHRHFGHAEGRKGVPVKKTNFRLMALIYIEFIVMDVFHFFRLVVLWKILALQ